MTVKPSKYVIGARKVDFLGHNVGDGMVGLHNDNVEKIKYADRPQTKRDVRSFLGLTGYYRDYIPHYAAIAAPLTDLTKKGCPRIVQWSVVHENAFKTLKSNLISAPILKIPDITQPFVLCCDASSIGLGAVLLQYRNDELFSVSYASKKLSNAEKKYSTIERECLAVIWAIKKFKMWLYGVEFTFQTDHQPLQFIDQAKFTNDRIMRWALFLQNYKIKFHCVKGVDNVGADYMSRIIHPE